VEEAICNAGTYHPDLEFLARRRILLSVGAKDGAATGGSATAAATVALFAVIFWNIDMM
jgi:hypothetical protein